MTTKHADQARPYQINGEILGGIEVSGDGVFEGLPSAANTLADGASAPTGSLNSTAFAGSAQTVISALNQLAYDDTVLTSGISSNASDIATNSSSISTNSSNITTNANGLAAVVSSDLTLSPGAGFSTLGVYDVNGGAQTIVVAVDEVLQDLDALGEVDAADKFIVSTGAGAFAYESGATVRSSLGLVIGTDVQAFDAELDALAGLVSAANKVPMFSGSGTATMLDFVDEDNMASDSATAVPSQQSVKAYVDSQVGGADLDFQGDSGGALSIDLDSQTLTFSGGTGISAAGSGTTLTYNLDAEIAKLAGMLAADELAVLTPTEMAILDDATVTTAELNILDGDTAATSTTIVDADRVVLNDNGTMVQAAVSDFDAYVSGKNSTISGVKTFNAGSLKIVGTAADGTTSETYTVEIDGGILKLNPAS